MENVTELSAEAEASVADTEEKKPVFDYEITSTADLIDRKKKLADIKERDVAEYERIIQSMKEKGIKRLTQVDYEVNRELRLRRRLADQAKHVREDGFAVNKKGEIFEDDADNIRLAFELLGLKLAYNEFSGQPEVEGLDGFGPALDDMTVGRIWLSLDEKFGFRPSRQLFEFVLFDECALRKHHPVVDYLAGLKWDGVERLDRWLVTYAHAKDNQYVRAVGALLLIAAVRRVRQPGAKFDEMLILESPTQGMGKSALIEALAVVDDWFTDSMQLNLDDKRMIESTSGIWICEVGELQGMRKGEVERIRAQLSRRHDRARLAYARLPTRVPRQFVLIGSTNASADAPYLADIDGNRRMWPVRVGKCEVEPMIRDRDQLWAEAAAREASGVSIRLPEKLWALAAREQRARAIGNALTGPLGTALGDKSGFVTAEDAWRVLGIAVEKRDGLNNRFGHAMRDLGWKRVNRRIKGVQTWIYKKGNVDRRLLAVEDIGHRGQYRLVYEDEYYRHPFEGPDVGEAD